MKVWAAVWLLLAAAGGWADAFPLPNGGQLELFPVGKWRLGTEDIGEIRFILMPENPRINARAVYSIGTEGGDEYPTDEKLREQMTRVAERLLAGGEFVERRPVVKPLFPPQGFGYYTVMTDRRLVGRPTVPGDYKVVSLGMIRLAPGVMLKIQVLGESEEDPAYQQLLGIAEGAIYTPPKG
jgi:hypothetical protein